MLFDVLRPLKCSNNRWCITEADPDTNLMGGGGRGGAETISGGLSPQIPNRNLIRVQWGAVII